ncbi:hypothetical protein LDENG_00140650 [Lucifuga dentata]|nr:hypothetical protein LDENG_00140650 [Lucifuga dentata]
MFHEAKLSWRWTLQDFLSPGYLLDLWIFCLSGHLIPLHHPLRWNCSFCSFCTVPVTDSPPPYTPI